MKQSVDLMNLMILMKRIHSYAHLHLKRTARCAVLLVAMLLGSGTTTWGQIANVTTGVIGEQSQVATYYQLLRGYPVELSMPDIVSAWDGDNNALSGEHWNGTNNSNYYDRWRADALNKRDNYKNTTIALPKGKYTILSAARASIGATLYFAVNNNEVQMPGVGNSVKGIDTSGNASFEGGTYANNNNGYGWRYFYIQFEVTADNTSLALRVSGSSPRDAWMSFTTPRLFASRSVDHLVTHKMSYLKDYADKYQEMDLDKQGLATDAQSDWWNYDRETQKVNHFEITHYVKQGKTILCAMPTMLNGNNDHVLYQRWYNYDNETDVNGLRRHVALDNSVPYYFYRNGMVTGRKLYWRFNENTGVTWRSALCNFNYTNSDGNAFTVAADVSRYSDMTYQNAASPLDGDLEEPSLTMRYIYYMKDAREMAANLTAKPEIANSVNKDEWLEYKEIHFPEKQLAYESAKWAGYRGEFIGVRHIFSDYWVFDDPNLVNTYNAGVASGADLSSLNDRLIPAVSNNNSGRIKVEIYDPHGTGIRLGGYNPNMNLNARRSLTEGNDADYQGLYLYDMMANKASYGDSRFVVFRYPSTGVAAKTGPDNPAYVNVYFDAGNRRYQLAQYKIIFDKGTETLPWKDVTVPVDITGVKGTDRDPNKLREEAGKPIAKITFDYPYPSDEPNVHTYHYPSSGTTLHNGGDQAAGGTIDNSSPVPLTFNKTNYAFDGDNANWGSYAMVSGKETRWGKRQWTEPANAETYGYGIDPDPNFKSAFLYIDASEQPGDICSAPFVGDFCAGDVLKFSGWISGSNTYEDKGNWRCPGGVTLTVKGEHMVNGKLTTETLYRFCPGQCYELDDNSVAISNYASNVPASEQRKYHVVWQQFYFEFTVTNKYDRHWIEVNNNCVSSNGGDFMLDNIEVYAVVPEVIPDINTPICVGADGTVDMRLLKLRMNHNRLKSSSGVNNSTAKEGFVFLEKETFLSTLKAQKNYAGTIEELAEAIRTGEYQLEGTDAGYQAAFDAALLGEKKIWDSTNPAANEGAGVMYFEWNSDFNAMEPFSFAKAVERQGAVFRETIGTGDDAENFVVMNGNYPKLLWKANTEYYIVPSNATMGNISEVYGKFNLCSQCSKASVFMIEPPYTLLGLGASEEANDYVVCEGQIPTLVTDLKGYDFNGVEVPMNDINYDWWLGDMTADPKVLPTLENYHAQQKGDIELDVALSTLRIYYPDATSLDGIIGHEAVGPHPALTLEMVNYLKELVNAGQLVLHQKSLNVPAKPASADDPYFYMVACPIHDEQFDQALNPHGLTSVIHNGSMEGYDTSSFYMQTPSSGGIKPATITAGAGKDDSRGIKITSARSDGNNWDTQFFIRASEKIPVGTTFHLKFDYKASSAATVHTQFQSSLGGYISEGAIGNLSFTTEWKHFEKDIKVTADMASNNNFQTIAFDLWTDKTAKDYYFDNVELTFDKNHYVAFFCDEPQGLRVKVGEKAPTLKTGFVPGENGFDSYNYEGAGDAVLSIRLAKKEQFEKVKHGTENERPLDWETHSEVNYLWLPLRNAVVQSGESDRVIQKSEDENIYLASTNDPVWDKNIYKAMKKGSLPIVGKIVQLTAIDTGKSGSGTENDNNRLCIYFTGNFNVREGYGYTLSLPFQESPGSNTCDGTILINLKIVPDYEVWTGAAGNTDWNNDENWRRADGNLGTSTEEPKNGAGRNNNELNRTGDLPDSSPLKDYVTNYTNYRTAKDRLLRKGFAPLYCTHVLIKSNEWGDAPVLYDALDGKDNLLASPFPNLRDKDGWDGNADTKATSTPILRYDMQARLYDIWSDTYGSEPNKGRAGDLIAEMYQVNSCDEIAFQPGAEMLNAHLLNYNNAWVEYQLNNKRWYLLGSPLQGTISGEWYAPTGTAQQKTTYYEPVTFGDGYDRYSPAIYQRSWDKAKAVLYEIGANYSTDDNPDDLALVNGQLPGSPLQGTWNGDNWDTTGANDYLDRLGYKPLGDKKVNVAMKGIWSNTYNDATVDYTKGGFSVMVMNHLKNNDESGGHAIIRLPKEDTMYDYYKFEETGAADGGTDTNLQDVQSVLNRGKNRGRLKSDLLLPKVDKTVVSETYKQIQREETNPSRYGDKRTYTRIPTQKGTNALPMELQSFSENVSAGISNLGYYLVENPFVAGLDMEKFFDANTGLERKYWILTASGQQLVQQVANGDWISPSADPVTVTEDGQTVTLYPKGKVAPGQGFFVQATNPAAAPSITFNADMQAKTRYGEPDEGTKYGIVVGTKQVMELIPAVDEEGNVLIENSDTIKVEIPKVDDQGNPVLEEIIDTVTIYKYRQKKGTGYQYPLKARTRGGDSSLFTLHSSLPGLFITARRDGLQSSALVMERASGSNDFLPEEDTEVFTADDQELVPLVYTLCGRLATTVNTVQRLRCLPLGVESASDAPCTLTFEGVEALGDSIAIYDAVEQTLTPLESGHQLTVNGQTQNRYYLVRGLSFEEAAQESNVQLFARQRQVTVVASTEEPIVSIRCTDGAGRLVYTAEPQVSTFSFQLPTSGVYIIEARTAKDRATRKIVAP